jgi:hypothetical protein
MTLCVQYTRLLFLHDFCNGLDDVEYSLSVDIHHTVVFALCSLWKGEVCCDINLIDG